MIYWEEEDQVSAEAEIGVSDLAFPVKGKELAIDHAAALHNALIHQVPWLDEHRIGIHRIQVAASGNGWYSPLDSAGATLLLPRRTKLVLRVRREETLAVSRLLRGAKLDVAGSSLELGEPLVRKLYPATSLFARFVLLRPNEQEAEFLARIIAELQSMGVRCKKVVCGRAHTATLPEGVVETLSVMLTDLSMDESIQLQEQGIGTHQGFGCGLFIPHKDVKK